VLNLQPNHLRSLRVNPLYNHLDNLLLNQVTYQLAILRLTQPPNQRINLR
jgi:hypothetical protein